MAPYDLVSTDDGSLTCYHDDTGELYHNRAGAYTEALVNYVEPSHVMQKIEEGGDIRLLDVCFGLGYNTWVLLEKVLEHARNPIKVEVLAIENDPAIFRVLPSVLDYPRFHHLKRCLPALEHNIYYQTQGLTYEMLKKGVIIESEKARIELGLWEPDGKIWPVRQIF